MRKIIPLLIVTLFANPIFVGGCRKPQQLADEDGAVYKKRLAGIYLAKAAVSLRAVSGATQVLVKAAKLSKESAITIYNTDDKAADVLMTIRDRVLSGFPGDDTLSKIDAILSDIQQIEALGVLNLTDTARNQFIIITGSVRAGLAALRAVLVNQQEPGVTRQAIRAQSEIHRARIQARNPQWVFDLIQVVLTAYGDAESLNNHPTVEAAFIAVASIVNTLKSLNNQRRAELG